MKDVFHNFKTYRRMRGEEVERVPHSCPAIPHPTKPHHDLLKVETNHVLPLYKVLCASYCPQHKDLGLGALFTVTTSSLRAPSPAYPPHKPRTGSALPVSSSPVLPGQCGLTLDSAISLGLG